MMPTVALLAWPVISAVLFLSLRVPAAILVSVTAGYLLLPPSFGINLPLVPTLDKASVPVLSALLFAALATVRMAPGEMRPGWIPKGLLPRLLLAGLLAGAFLTVYTNGDTLVRGGQVARGMRLYDGFSTLLGLLVMLVPFVLARKFLATAESHRTLLLVLALAALAYSLPTLFEVRMSPQLNRMVYGYFPHSWVQHVRGSGFRPVVFMEHGLWLSIFIAMGFLAALGCLRAYRGDSRWLWPLAGLWLFVTLVLTKSLGALMIAVVLAPVVLLFGRRLQLLAVAVIAAMIVTYPVLRGSHLAPVEPVLSVAERIDAQRASSFRFRVENEEILLARAMERPLFGWGGYSRSRVYDERGRDISVTDGYWIIIVGQGGWVRYLGEFGLLLLPVLFLAVRFRKYDVGPETAIVAVVLVANAIDLIPNAGIFPMTWLMAGALWGRLELGHVGAGAPDAPAPAAARRAPALTRGEGPVYARRFPQQTRPERPT